jgi:hypothetical protein
MKVLNAMASMVSVCSLHVIFLLKNTPRYFTVFTNEMFCLFNVRSESGRLNSMRERSGLAFINFYISAFAPLSLTLVVVF